MNAVVQLSRKENMKENFHSTIIATKESLIKISELVLGDNFHILMLFHSKISTFLELSKCDDFQLLYFDANKKFIGASYAINTSNGDFLSQVQAKWVLFIPLKMKLSPELINEIEFFSLQYYFNDSTRPELEKFIQEKFPISTHNHEDKTFTCLRRMKVEQWLDVPIVWRINFAIPLETERVIKPAFGIVPKPDSQCHKIIF